MRRLLRLPRVASLSLLALAAGCGAKTGLFVPDASLEAVPEPDASVLEPAPLCVELDREGEGEGAVLPLQTTAAVGRADVALLVDVSGSMAGEIAAIRRELRDVIVPGIEAQIPDVHLAVTSFSDFPTLPFGVAGSDAPFRQRVAMTGDIADVQGGVDALDLEDGRDHHESHVEALYQLATGEGLSGWVEPSFGCASGGVGYPCFRPDALPVVLLFTDAPMHSGPAGGPGYGDLSPAPHTYSDARRALRDLGARVIGFFSGARRSADRRDLELLAHDTRALDRGGAPLVFDIGQDGRGLGTDVIDAIEVFASDVTFDVDVVIRDADDDGVDATQFIDRVVPVRARPATAVERIDRATGLFHGLRSGAEIVYEVRLRSGVSVPGEGPQRFSLIATFRADGREVLGEVPFQIVLPGADGQGC